MREALAGYGAMLHLDPDAMLATATERTGLDDWGDPAFRERLEVLCTALRDEAGLSDTGTAVVFEQLVGNLVNRLRLQALTTAHPEIERRPDRAADHHLRAAAHGHHPPAQPAGRRSRRCGTCRTGRASNRSRPRMNPASRPVATGVRPDWIW